MATWNLEAIATALGGSLRQRKPHVVTIELTHARLGTRLKLDLAPDYDAIRVSCDRNDDGRLTLLGRIDLVDIAEIAVAEDAGIVRFRTRRPSPSELEVRADATFLLTAGPCSARPNMVGNAAEVGSGEELVQLVGRLARPHYSERTGRPFFTAGLAEYRDGAMAPVWHNLKAFDGVAQGAQHLERGQWVRLTGRQQEDRYQKNGEQMAKPVILLVHIEAAD